MTGRLATLMHTVFQKTLITILRGRFICSHVTLEETEASGTWEAVQDGAKDNKVQRGASQRDLASNPTGNVASCVTLRVFIQISGPPFSPPCVYNNNSHSRVLF